MKARQPGERFWSDKTPVRMQARTMKYFFHLEDGTCIRDPTGEEFANDVAAMLEAVIVAHELSKAKLHAHKWQVVVKDKAGRRVGSVPLVPPATPAQDVPLPSSSIH
jgi:hypothetical protein